MGLVSRPAGLWRILVNRLEIEGRDLDVRGLRERLGTKLETAPSYEWLAVRLPSRYTAAADEALEALQREQREEDQRCQS
jgi:hypothetical protein